MIKEIGYAHELIANCTTKLDVTIDATVGSGKDTIFLSRISKKVYGFDIQKEALEAAQKLLDQENRNNVSLILDGHENIDKYVNEYVSGCIFNLGYMFDKDTLIHTKINQVIIALNKTLQLLKIGGKICVLSNNLNDNNLLEEWAKQLNNKQYQVLKYQYINNPNNKNLLVIEKIK